MAISQGIPWDKRHCINVVPAWVTTSGNPCLQGTDGGPARVGWATMAHRHTQGFFFFFAPQ